MPEVTFCITDGTSYFVGTKKGNLPVLSKIGGLSFSTREEAEDTLTNLRVEEIVNDSFYVEQFYN